jgi:hypothetical protein
MRMPGTSRGASAAAGLLREKIATEAFVAETLAARDDLMAIYSGITVSGAGIPLG